jgi:cytochrome oxidase Cu insertion factor (SCO1/SenC/PrrC family)
MTSPEPERTPPTRRSPDTDDFPTGPAIGEVFPDFTLRNQRNEAVNLATARAGQKALVVFQRSARW